MPLPNTNTPNTGGDNNYKPDSAFVNRAGASLDDIKKLQDQNQKVSKILQSLSAKLDNITNIRSNIQQATFDAGGNNFITRGINQAMNGISESIEGFLSAPQEEPEDEPLVAAIKKQTEVLNSVKESSSRQLTLFEKLSNEGLKSNESILLIEQNSTKQLEYSEKTNSILIEQGDHVKDEVSLLTTAVNESATSLVETISTSGKHVSRNINKVESAIKILAVAISGSASKGQSGRIRRYGENKAEPVSPAMPGKNDSENIFGPSPSYKKNKKFVFNNETDKEPIDVEIKGEPKAPIEEPKSANVSSNIPIFESINKHIQESNKLLEKLVNIQSAMSDNLSKMFTGEKAQSINQQAKESESEAKVAGNAEANTIQEPTANGPVIKAGFKQGFKDFASVFKKPATELAEASADTAEGASVMDGMAGVATEAASSVGGDWLAKGAGLLGTAAKGLAGGGVAALAGEGLQMGGDYLKDSGYEQTGKAVDVGGTALKYAGIGAMAGSVIPGVGTAVGAGIGGVIGAGKGIYDQYFSDESKGKDSKAMLDNIETTQKSIDDTNKKPETTSTPVVNNNSVVNNQSIFPARQVVKNQDDSLNRYISSTMNRFA